MEIKIKLNYMKFNFVSKRERTMGDSKESVDDAKKEEVKGLDDELVMPGHIAAFFNHKLHKFCTEFEIGKKKIKLYGNPLVMLMRSELITTYLDLMTSSDPPYPLLPEADVELTTGLISVWGFMNTNILWHDNFKIVDYLEVWKWLNYFKVPFMTPEISENWIIHLTNTVKKSKLNDEEKKALGVIFDMSIKYTIMNTDRRLSLINIIDVMYMFMKDNGIESKYHPVEYAKDRSVAYIRKESMKDEKSLIADLATFGIKRHEAEVYNSWLNPIFRYKSAIVFISNTYRLCEYTLKEQFIINTDKKTSDGRSIYQRYPNTLDQPSSLVVMGLAGTWEYYYET